MTVNPRDVAAMICTIESRAQLCERAVRSIEGGTVRPARIVVEVTPEPDDWADLLFLARKRSRAIRRARAPWIATLDDDDTWDPWHLEHLIERQAASQATTVFGRGRLCVDGVTSETGGFFTASAALFRRETLMRAGGWGACLGRGEDHRLDDVCAQHALVAAGNYTHGERYSWTHYIDSGRPHVDPLWAGFSSADVASVPAEVSARL